MKSVIHAGIYLGDLYCVDKSDWKNKERDPTPLDFENIRITLAASTIKSILDKYPKRPKGSDEFELWPMTVIKAVCHVSKGRHDTPFSEDVLRSYIERYGMGQIIRCVGGDPNRVMEALDRMRAEV
jgi:hypothetical protein